MFTRIVKMKFEKEKIPAFLANFETVKEKIRNFRVALFWNFTRIRMTKQSFSPTAVGMRKPIWKTIEQVNFSKTFGVLQNRCLNQKRKHGV
jgi:hypothetical protein